MSRSGGSCPSLMMSGSFVREDPGTFDDSLLVGESGLSLPALSSKCTDFSVSEIDGIACDSVVSRVKDSFRSPLSRLSSDCRST